MDKSIEINKLNIKNVVSESMNLGNPLNSSQTQNYIKENHRIKYPNRRICYSYSPERMSELILFANANKHE